MGKITYVELNDLDSDHTIENPTPDDLQALVEGLGTSVEHFKVYWPQGYLNVGYAGSDRARVRYVRTNFHDTSLPEGWSYAKLVDEGYAASNETIEIFADGVQDAVRLYNTVEKGIALQVSAYYLANAAIPDDARWVHFSDEGNIT